MDKLLYWFKVWATTILGANLLIALFSIIQYNESFSGFMNFYLMLAFFSTIFSAPTFIILGLLLSFYKTENQRKLKWILAALSIVGVILSFSFIGLNIFTEPEESYMPFIYMFVMVSAIWVYEIPKKKPIRLVIFDLDGTLLNTYEDLGNAVNHVLAKYQFPIHPLESYKTFIGNGIDNLLRTCLPENFKDEVQFQIIRNEFVEFYEAHKCNQTKPYDGIYELLQNLTQQNIKLAIASNKYHEATVELVDKYFSEFHFEVVFGHRADKPKKPNPTIVFDILQHTKCQNDEALFVGDSGIDMQTAHNAYVSAVGVTWGFRTEEELRNHSANHIVHHPEEILKLIKPC